MTYCHHTAQINKHLRDEDAAEALYSFTDEVEEELAEMPISELFSDDERLVGIVHDIACKKARQRIAEAKEQADQDKAAMLADLRDGY